MFGKYFLHMENFHTEKKKKIKIKSRFASPFLTTALPALPARFYTSNQKIALKGEVTLFKTH